MDMITVSAKTLDEAITKALIELQTTSDHLHYEIIQKESSGLLGIFGVKPCVIRARVMSEEEELALKREAAGKEKAEKEKAQREAKEAAEKAKAEKAQKEAAERAQRDAAEKAKSEKAEKPERAEYSERAKKSAEKQDRRPEKRDNDRKRNEKRDFEKREKQNVPEVRAEKPEKPEREAKPVKADEAVVRKAAKDFLEQVFGAMGMNVSVETKLDLAEGELQVMMSGDDMGILIGKRGQTLDSLQYLVSLVVNKETEGYLRVKLDTENYRERRKETLETLARNISYKVKRTKRPVSLEPMNPYERRIIHSALQNDRYVTTRSEGEDPYRHVVISLKREGYNGGRKDRYNNSRRDRGRSAEKSAEKNMEKTVDKTAGKTEEVSGTIQ